MRQERPIITLKYLFNYNLQYQLVTFKNLQILIIGIVGLIEDEGFPLLTVYLLNRVNNNLTQINI